MLLNVFGKLPGILTRRERIQTGLLIVLLLITAILEAVSIASVLPFLSVAANPDMVASNQHLAWLYRISPAEDIDGFLIMLGVGALLVMLFGLALKSLVIYAMTRFGNMRVFSISARLLEAYSRRPYVWFLSEHSSALAKTVLSETQEAVNGALIPALRLVAQAFVIVSLLTMLLLVDPLVAGVSLLVFGGAYALLLLVLRRYLVVIGQRRVEANRQRFQIVQDLLSGIKEIKFLQLEATYLRHFRKPAVTFSDCKAKAAVLGEVPRHAIEGLAFGGIIAVTLFMLFRADGNLPEIIPVLGLYAVAGLRLLPALQQVYLHLTKLRFTEPVLNNFIDVLEEAEQQVQLEPVVDQAVKSERAGEHLLKPPTSGFAMQDIWFRFPGSEMFILRSVDFDVRVGEIVGIAGPTGAGKTTLVDVLLGLLAPERGRLLVDGHQVPPEALPAWQRLIAYVPQSTFLVDDTLAFNIAFPEKGQAIDMDRVRAAARVAQIDGFIENDLEAGYATTVGERGARLSGGQKQRLGIARAIHRNAPILVLDEATSALDESTQERVMQSLLNDDPNRSIVMIAHRPSTLRLANRIYCLERGRVRDVVSYQQFLTNKADTSANGERLAK